MNIEKVAKLCLEGEFNKYPNVQRMFDPSFPLVAFGHAVFAKSTCHLFLLYIDRACLELPEQNQIPFIYALPTPR
jgi:hypothetical protein